jgi:putative serine protease PepD
MNELPDTSRKFSDPTPWWIAPSRNGLGRTVTLRTALLIALVVGVVAGTFGAASSGSIFGRSVNLVKSTAAIERPAGSVAEIAQRVLPSVVSIETRSSDGGSSGSGFVIDSSGFILTNNHVIDSAATSGGQIKVRLSTGDLYTAKVIGRDSSYDLAVLKITAPNLKALQFGDSDEVAVGDSVIAIGSPLGLSGTVTLGIISAKNRAVTAGEREAENSFINALQTDAAINPGNSGGPLVDSTGAVIGVNSAIATLGYSFGPRTGSIGLGFAIPINQARKTADQLIKSGKATYPVMGISVDMNFSGKGALIAKETGSIVPGGPASLAGIRAGDIITEIDGRVITSPEELIVAIRSHSIGEEIDVSYERDGISKSVRLTLAASD